MKKIILICASIFLLMVNQVCFALDSQAQKESALLQGYIVRYTENIQTKSKQLRISNNSFLNEKLSELLSLKKDLTNLEKIDTNYNDAELRMKEIVAKLKTINNEVKNYFEHEEELYYYNLELSKRSYTLAAQKLANITDNFIEKLSHSFLKESKLNTKQKKIVSELVRMQEASQKLKNFQSVSFTSMEEMKNYIADAIEDLKKAMNKITSLSR